MDEQEAHVVEGVKLLREGGEVLGQLNIRVFLPVSCRPGLLVTESTHSSEFLLELGRIHRW